MLPAYTSAYDANALPKAAILFDGYLSFPTARSSPAASSPALGGDPQALSSHSESHEAASRAAGWLPWIR